jgi:enterochelin esterase-like enzyme
MRRFFAFALLLASTANATTQTVTIFSPSNGRNISFVIYTPPNYSTSTERYPLVLSLHGKGGTAAGRSTAVTPTLNAAITAGTARPMIFVFPDGQTDAFYGDAYNGSKRVYSNIIGEVLPYVETNFRTIANRNGRAIEGFSMGGFGASMYAAKHPELFSAIVEYGGALSKWQDILNFDSDTALAMYNNTESNFLPYSLWDLTTANATAIRTTINYKMLVGDADGQQNSNQRFRDHLLSLNIDPHYQVLPGIAHVQGDYFAEGSGLEFLDNHFASVPEPGGAAVMLLFATALRRRR